MRRDPDSSNSSRPSWFCAIEDYVPFSPPVPAKLNGVFYEDIPQNMWRNGVRNLDRETFNRVVAAAESKLSIRTQTDLPPTVEPIEADNLIVPRGRVANGAGGKSVGYRKSKRAKEVGDWAEYRVVTFLEDIGGCAEITHRAARGETPGWDIDYRDPAGVLHRVEVKGTVAGAFTTIDITANELRAASEHGDQYWIFLVASCQTDRPRIQRICNPAERLADGLWTATPAVYSVRLG